MQVDRVAKCALLLFVMLASFFVHADTGYSTGKNIIVNGGFDQDKDKNGVPDGWTRSVQMPGAKAEVVMEKYRSGNCMRIKFFNPANMLQARVYQKFNLTPGKVYELKYDYKSGISGKFKADILMTGTGPIYRSIYNVPVKDWVSVKKIFLVPSWMKGPAVIYVQNRSTVPVWYKNISFCETSIDPKKVKDYQPEVAIQALTSDDQLIMPGSAQKEVVYLIRVKAPDSMKEHLYTEAYLVTGKNKYLKCKVNGDRISIPIAGISDGTSTINVFLYNRKSKTLVATTKIDLEKIPASMMKGEIDLRQSAVFKDPAGNPFFPIGMYGLRMDSPSWDFKALKNAGFNTVHCYSFEGGKLDSKRINGVKTFLDRAEESGQKVIFGIPRQLAEGSGKAKQLVNWLNNFKDHPAILYYYSDEMYGMRHTPMKTFKATRDALRQVSPKTKWIIFDSIESKLAPHIDGIMSGINTANASKLLRLRLGKDMPGFAVFGQRDYKAAKAPSEKEIRYSIFMPVVLGARGVFYWWYPTLVWNNQEKELLKERLFANTKILAEVGPAMVSGKKLPGWTQKVKVSGDARYCAGTANDVIYLLAGVEKTGKGGTVEFSVPDGCKVEPLFDCELKSDGQKHTISLKPEDTAVIKIVK